MAEDKEFIEHNLETFIEYQNENFDSELVEDVIIEKAEEIISRRRTEAESKRQDLVSMMRKMRKRPNKHVHSYIGQKRSGKTQFSYGGRFMAQFLNQQYEEDIKAFNPETGELEDLEWIKPEEEE